MVGKKRWPLTFIGHILNIRKRQSRSKANEYTNMVIKTECLYMSDCLCMTGKAEVRKAKKFQKKDFLK